MKPEDVPDNAVRAVAGQLLRDYDTEFNASHLHWRDFAPQARKLISVAVPHVYRALDTQVAAERRGRLAAEAAVRRVREMIAHEIRTGNGASAYTLRRILNALDAEQPKETP